MMRIDKFYLISFFFELGIDYFYKRIKQLPNSGISNKCNMFIYKAVLCFAEINKETLITINKTSMLAFQSTLFVKKVVQDYHTHSYVALEIGGQVCLTNQHMDDQLTLQ